MNKLKLNILIMSITLMACYQTKLFSQCAPGPFSVDPANAQVLDCTINVSTIADACDDLSFPPSTFTNLTVPSGTQVCFELPDTGGYNFQTCGLTTDDTFITLFDEFGNLITFSDDGCGLQSSIGIFRSQGEVLCIQVESATLGVCEGVNSTSPSYDIQVFCFSRIIDEFELVLEDADVCSATGFSAIETATPETGLAVNTIQGSTPFVFNTGTTSQTNGSYTSGSLTVCVQGDLGSVFELWQIIDENGNCMGGIGNSFDLGLGDCVDEPICTSFNLDSNMVASIVADGIVTFEALNGDGQIQAFCDFNAVSMELNLCADNVIPTMGEWGLMCLGIVLLTFGVVAIRDKQFAMH